MSCVCCAICVCVCVCGGLTNCSNRGGVLSVCVTERCGISQSDPRELIGFNGRQCGHMGLCVIV